MSGTSNDLSKSTKFVVSSPSPLYTIKFVPLKDRDNDISRLKELFSKKIYTEEDKEDKCKDKAWYPITFSSGMAGIGKTSLGESAIAMVISSLNGEEKTTDFARGL